MGERTGPRAARFLFLGRLDPEGSRAPGWPWPGKVPETPEDTWFAWSLVSSNNGELGRSWQVFETYRACREAARLLQVSSAQVETEIESEETHGWFGWRLALAARTVAVSGRWYQRERESRYSLDKFLIALPAAALAGGVRQIDGRVGRHTAAGPDRGVPLRRVAVPPVLPGIAAATGTY